MFRGGGDDFVKFWSKNDPKGLEGESRPKKTLKSSYHRQKLSSSLSKPPENTPQLNRRVFGMFRGGGDDFGKFWSKNDPKGLNP